jgi:hypothetical protein
MSKPFNTTGRGDVPDKEGKMPKDAPLVFKPKKEKEKK